MHTFNVHFNVYSWLKNDSKRKVATTSVTLSDGVFHVQHECWLEVISGVWESGFFFILSFDRVKKKEKLVGIERKTKLKGCEMEALHHHILPR